MKANNILKKQIIIEIIALLFLIITIIYSVSVITSPNNKVDSKDGFVTMLDDINFNNKLEKLSDGKGLSTEGLKYNITNNNDILKTYKLIIIPSYSNEEILSGIRIGLDDLYIETITELPKEDEGYVISTQSLKPGHTRINLIKLWYSLNAKEIKDDITFEFKIKVIE